MTKGEQENTQRFGLPSLSANTPFYGGELLHNRSTDPAGRSINCIVPYQTRYCASPRT